MDVKQLYAIVLDEMSQAERNESASTVPPELRPMLSEAMLRREEDLRNAADVFNRIADVARDFAILVSGVSSDFRKG